MARSTKTLNVGDHAIPFALSDQSREVIYLRDEAGKPTILIFYASDEIPTCQDIACAFRDLMPTFNKFDVQIYIISPDLPEVHQKFAREYGIPFPLLSDSHQNVSKKYGVCFPKDNNRGVMQYSRAAFLLDPNQRIVQIYSLKHLSVSIEAMLTDIQNLLPQEEARHMTMQAPVLLIPNVLSVNLCNYLIDIWQIKGNDESGFMCQSGDKTVGYIDHTHKIRRDHFLKDPQVVARLDKIMRSIVFPEIKKVFNFEVTRREAYRIACYDSSLGGFFNVHRDNTTGGTAHRRFAMTLNLNMGEYEGGFLRFPEYGPHLYKPNTGGVVIFSCSLMHEATRVTSGLRFALLTFFYGEKEAESRINYENKAQNDYNAVVRVNS